jgi:integrase
MKEFEFISPGRWMPLSQSQTGSATDLCCNSTPKSARGEAAVGFHFRHLDQYARLVHSWISGIGLEAASYGAHSMRRTKAARIYRKTGSLRAVQLLLGHTKLESTVRYLGIEMDDALNMAEQIEL